MRQHWRIRIRGKQRKTVDIGLLVQAIVALGRQLAREQTAAKQTTAAGTTTTGVIPQPTPETDSQ